MRPFGLFLIIAGKNILIGAHSGNSRREN